MQPALRHQLAELDRAILALVNERARLLSVVEADDPSRLAMVSDLLRRHDGPFNAAALDAMFDAIDAGCQSQEVVLGTPGVKS